MEIEVQFPLDTDGFLRRECPHCFEQFKWHHGPANEEAESAVDPPAYYCPLCGQPAGPASWYTQTQLDYMDEAAAPAIAQFLDDAISEVFKGSSTKNVKFNRTGHLHVPDHPEPLSEPDDMVIVASPCHGYEPVKVPAEHTGPLCCLVCGAAFAV
jgi:hypothetical protein